MCSKCDQYLSFACDTWTDTLFLAQTSTLQKTIWNIQLFHKFCRFSRSSGTATHHRIQLACFSKRVHSYFRSASGNFISFLLPTLLPHTSQTFLPSRRWSSLSSVSEASFAMYTTCKSILYSSHPQTLYRAVVFSHSSMQVELMFLKLFAPQWTSLGMISICFIRLVIF